MLLREFTVTVRLEESRDAGPGKDGRESGPRLRRHHGVAFDFAGPQLKGRLGRLFDEPFGDAAAPPGTRHIKAVDRPGLLRPTPFERLHALQPGKCAPRAKRAPSDRLLPREGEDTLHRALLDELAKGLAVLGSFRLGP